MGTVIIILKAQVKTLKNNIFKNHISIFVDQYSYLLIVAKNNEFLLYLQ